MQNEKKRPSLKRNFISLQTKIEILDQIKNQERIADIGRHFNLNESTIRSIKQSEEKIRNSVASGSSILAKNVARPSAPIMEKMEQALILWVEDVNKKRLPLNKGALKHKALKIFDYLKQMGQSSADETSVKFVASNGWFEKFKKRHSLHNIHIQGEKASADEDAAKKYPAELADIIQTKGYLADQVFNADETGLSWKKMPNRTYISKNEKTAPGFKVSKDRITLLLCCNASGDFITKPMLIHRALNPRSMKQCNKNDLPAYWRANKKARMTGHLVEDWFHNCFVPDVENYLKKKNLAFKVLLILDNAPSHPIDLNHPSVEIAFSPRNTTSLLQPLDQGIVATFKLYYIRGDGFTEITVDDILELVTENEINEAHLVTVISETLPIEDFFNEETKNFTLKENGNLQNGLSAYQEIYKDLQSESQQSLMTDFLKPKPTRSAVELEIRPVKHSRTTIISDDED
ncbi:tigger transposable element-derived protein 1-like [Centruroides vittatus]|uniref:tigger transposable element-derived protein 1-like n=1 Tax=Centruroides vittatus TaxID=120091 RepID=UPI00350E964D